jgi:HMG (high mobility group) box protein
MWNQLDPKCLAEACRQFSEAFSNLADALAPQNQPKPTHEMVHTEVASPLSDVVAEAKQQTKKKRVAKDPDAPKKPPSGYMIFYKDHFAEVKEEASKTTTEPKEVLKKVSTTIGKMWEGANKEPYLKRSGELRADYNEQMKEYQGSAVLGSPQAEDKASTWALKNNPFTAESGDDQEEKAAAATAEPPRKKSKKDKKERAPAPEEPKTASLLSEVTKRTEGAPSSSVLSSEPDGSQEKKKKKKHHHHHKKEKENLGSSQPQ